VEPCQVVWIFSNSAALQEMDDLEYIERIKNGFE